MYDCFISYTNHDSNLAIWIKSYLEIQGISVFMASISLDPGQHWPLATQKALRQSTWVIFLASRAACNSPYVQQEIGGAIFGGKTLIPVVWDMPPSSLPGWAQHYHAVDIRGLNPKVVTQQTQRIANFIQEKNKGKEKKACWLLAL
jgi:hypothetical protein